VVLTGSCCVDLSGRDVLWQGGEYSGELSTDIRCGVQAEMRSDGVSTKFTVDVRSTRCSSLHSHNQPQTGVVIVHTCQLKYVLEQERMLQNTTLEVSQNSNWFEIFRYKPTVSYRQAKAFLGYATYTTDRQQRIGFCLQML